MELYHLSFRKFSKELWKPRQPESATNINKDIRLDIKRGIYPEPSFSRICFSSEIVGAYYAIYPNICNLFKNKVYKHIDCYVYTPIVNESTKILPPSELTKKQWVWDAHFTKEYIIITPVELVLWGKVRFFNNEMDEYLITHPFDNKDLPLKKIAPPAKYKIISRRFK